MNINLTGYHKLIVYQKTKVLVLLTYKITKTFPGEELYVLLPQMRRAAISIMANIVEGYIKSSKKEFARFLDISIGSAAELQVYYELSLELQYISQNDFDNINALLSEVMKLLFSFRRSLKRRAESTLTFTL